MGAAGYAIATCDASLGWSSPNRDRCNTTYRTGRRASYHWTLTIAARLDAAGTRAKKRQVSTAA